MCYLTQKSLMKPKPFKYGNMDLQENCNESLANLLQICNGNCNPRIFARDLRGIHCKSFGNLRAFRFSRRFAREFARVPMQIPCNSYVSDFRV